MMASISTMSDQNVSTRFCFAFVFARSRLPIPRASHQPFDYGHRCRRRRQRHSTFGYLSPIDYEARHAAVQRLPQAA